MQCRNKTKRLNQRKINHLLHTLANPNRGTSGNVSLLLCKKQYYLLHNKFDLTLVDTCTVTYLFIFII